MEWNRIAALTDRPRAGGPDPAAAKDYRDIAAMLDAGVSLPEGPRQVGGVR